MEDSNVFVRDEVYGWLPGQLAKPISDGDSTAYVYLTLPDDWQTYTYKPDHPSLRRGTVEDESGKIIRTVKLDNYVGKELPLQNIDENGELLGKSDMADLPHLHEAAILYNLKDRHKSGVPYTRVGDIVVAVNPYQWIDGLYSEKKRRFYAKKLVWDVQEDDLSNRQGILEGYFDKLIHDPHVYETSCNAYRGLAVDRRDQAILVSGESGAGKTETVKIVMTHLATLENTRLTTDAVSDDRTGIVARISESNPLFEAFGNAKTARNDNSSRFGKFTKLHFYVKDPKMAKTQAGRGLHQQSTSASGRDIPNCALAGSTFETYLLEKSRVVAHNTNERTYHFFYQLLAAPEEDKAEFWEELKGAACESFRYVGEPETDAIEGCSDADAWHETKKALRDFGFSGERLKTLMQAVCTVLQLGNLTFGLDPSDDEGALIASHEELEKLSGLIGVGPRTFCNAVTTRKVKAVGEEIVVRLTPSAAKEGCDALAKEIYAQVFQALVEAINQSTNPPKFQEGAGKSVGCISILDMFGFECFAVNRFEQLCINYANECIQHKYALDTFLSIKEEYEAEGIEIYDFSKVDNSDILHLVEGRTGLIMVLNEECVRPKGNDESFVYKIKTIHRESDCLLNHRLHRPWEFAVRHFAGTVKYDATRFVERNTDQLPLALLECATSCKNDLIRNRFQQMASERAKQQSNYRRKRSAATITSKFKTQLTLLMNDIKDARTRYIRCIKPNSEKQPLVMDHEMTMRQLASAGLVTAITVSRETFPNHLPYEVVWDRFHILLPTDAKPWESGIRDKARYLLEELLKGRDKVVGGHVIAPFACGKTKVFFRSGSLELLESERLRIYSAKAIILQRWARKFMAEKRYRAIEPTVIILQAKWRCEGARKEYLKKRNAAMVIQCWGRRTLASSRAIHMQEFKAAATIQSLWRAQKPKKMLQQAKKAAEIVRRALKSKMDRNNFKSAMATVVEEAHMDHKMKLLQKKLEDPSSSDKDDLLRESAKMIEYLSRQLYMQRGRVSHLKADLAQKEEAKSHAVMQANSVEAALAANKLEVSKLRVTSTRLVQQLSEQKAGTASMRMLLGNVQDTHKRENSKLLMECNAMKGKYLKEIGALKNEVRLLKRDHAVEMSKVRHEMSILKEKHQAEIVELQEEMWKLEESHSDDLSKMLDALGMGTSPETVPGKVLTSNLGIHPATESCGESIHS